MIRIKSFTDYMIFVDNIIKDYEFDIREIEGDFPDTSKIKSHIDEITSKHNNIYIDSNISKRNKGRTRISVFLGDDELFYSFLTRTVLRPTEKEVYCKSLNANYSSNDIANRYFSDMRVQHTGVPCVMCGTVTLFKKRDGLCASCFNSKQKNKQRTKEITLSDGTILKGNDRIKHLKYEKRVKEKKEGLISGTHFKCSSCKKIKVIESKSKNKKTDICNWCAKNFAKRKEDNRQIENAKNVKEMIKRNRETPLYEKAEKLKNENDMIAKFLAKQKDSE